MIETLNERSDFAWSNEGVALPRTPIVTIKWGHKMKPYFYHGSVTSGIAEQCQSRYGGSNQRLTGICLLAQSAPWAAIPIDWCAVPIRLTTGCGFLKAVNFGCKPPLSRDFCRRHRIG
jgi:hypothetical protein